MWKGAFLLTLTLMAQPKPEWRSLFDGATLKGWNETPFTGRGRVSVEGGRIVLDFGMPMTGVTFTGSFRSPTMSSGLRACG
jgi:hypothetical protein